jgi:imidazole glycerol-phosphate synthase subunit HisH
VIALVDYGAGNLTSVTKALVHLGAQVAIAREPAALESAAAIIVPGVGHFAATSVLDDPWKQAIRSHVAAKRPLLGICLGMQWLFESSAEAPELAGLAFVAGRCRRLSGSAVKVPHVGWNALSFVRESWIVEGVRDGDQVYFTHSFAPPVTAETVATTEHGSPFASIVERGHVAGVQFHPEKSSRVGLTVLMNFLRLVR